MLFLSGVVKFYREKKRKTNNNLQILFFNLLIFNFVSTFIFYVIWMYLYLPSINANYMLQITNLLPFFGAYFIYKIKNVKNYYYALITLSILFILLIPTFIYGSSYLIN